MAILSYITCAYTAFTAVLAFACCEGCLATSGLGIPLAWSVILTAIMWQPPSAIPVYMRILLMSIGVAADLAYTINYIVALVRCALVGTCAAESALGFVVNQYAAMCSETLLLAVVLVMSGRISINIVYQIYSVKSNGHHTS